MTVNARKSLDAEGRQAAKPDIQVRGLNSDVRERLRVAIKDFGGQTLMASALGVRASSLSETLSGKSEPRTTLVARIAELSGRSLDWIMFGAEPKQPEAARNSFAGVATPQDTISVPFYNVRASAGPGALPLDEEPSATFSLDRQFARALGISASNIVALTVHGDSAQPNLYEGDTILVDRAYLDLRDGGLYVIGVDDDIVVKRVHRQMDRSIILKSDNPSYEPQHVSATDAERLRIVGRVRWAVRGF